MTRSDIEQVLADARRSWRQYGIWYAGTKAPAIPVDGPEHLFVITAELFAYDFKLQALVAAWLRKNTKSIDPDKIETLLGNEDVSGLSCAYVYATAAFLKWRCGLSAWNKWRSIEKAAKRQLSSLGQIEDVASWRREEVQSFYLKLRLRSDKRLRRLGLNLPAICVEDDRKILPRVEAFVSK